jgi:hypothetical protein
MGENVLGADNQQERLENSWIAEFVNDLECFI